jgi:hypothetical protein
LRRSSGNRRGFWGHRDRKPSRACNVKSGRTAGRAARAIANDHREERPIVGSCGGWRRVGQGSPATDRGVVFLPLVAERGCARRGYEESRRLPNRNIRADRLRRDGRGRWRGMAFGIAARARHSRASRKDEPSR